MIRQRRRITAATAAETAAVAATTTTTTITTIVLFLAKRDSRAAIRERGLCARLVSLAGPSAPLVLQPTAAVDPARGRSTPGLRPGRHSPAATGRGQCPRPGRARAEPFPAPAAPAAARMRNAREKAQPDEQEGDACGQGHSRPRARNPPAQARKLRVACGPGQATWLGPPLGATGPPAREGPPQDPSLLDAGGPPTAAPRQSLNEGTAAG